MTTEEQTEQEAEYNIYLEKQKQEAIKAEESTIE